MEVINDYFISCLLFFLTQLNVSCSSYYSYSPPCTLHPEPCPPKKITVTPKITSISLPPPVTRELPTKKTKSTASFDYYLLSLTWSPTFCEMRRHKTTQCQHLPHYRFVLHGLWPSDRRGAPPIFCSVQKVDPTTLQTVLSIMPDKNLIKHEWCKHGTCSGITPKEYFDLAKKNYHAIQFPDFFYSNEPVFKRVAEIKRALVEKNPTLRYDAIQVLNKKRELTEIRVCFDPHALHAIPCPTVPQGDEMTVLTIIPPQ